MFGQSAISKQFKRFFKKNTIPYEPPRQPGIALITGASRGIGYEVVRQLADLGWSVFLTARDVQAGAEAVSRLGSSVSFVEMDITNEASIVAAAQSVSNRIGALDLLINNAAVLFREEDQTVFDVSIHVLRQCWETNCIGPLLVAQAFMPLLRKSHSARIINVSSEAARLYTMKHYIPAYSISKCGLNAVTRQLAAACAPYRIPVNVICPGWVATKMGGPNAPRTAEDGARTIVWLGTRAPTEVTGQFIQDGHILRW